MQIDGSVLVITGASSGIGAATASLAADRGATVVLTARRGDRLEALADQVAGATGTRPVTVVEDITSPGASSRVVEAAVAAHGRVDAIVLNAGQGLRGSIAEVALEDLRAAVELNLVALVEGIQAVVPVMRAQGAGAIVTVSSGTTRMVLPGSGAYAATKAAVNMVAAVARAELEDEGIVVSNVLPFITTTEFHDVARGPVAPAPGGRRGMPPADPPEKVAAAVLDVLVSGEAEVVLLPAHRRQRPVAGPE